MPLTPLPESPTQMPTQSMPTKPMPTEPRNLGNPPSPGGGAPLPDDGTRQLLQAAFWVLLVGILAAAATRFVFGGVGEHGPHTSPGWLSLIVAMMCLPFGSMLLLLGGAKYLRNKRLSR